MLTYLQTLRAYLGQPWVRAAIGGLILIVCLGYLARMVLGMPTLPAMAQMNYLWLLWSLAITVVTVWLGAVEWWLILRSLGHEVGFGYAARAHLKANLAKYLPGYGWQLLGKVHLTARPGISYSAASVALAVEFGLLMAVGICVALGLSPAFPWTGQSWVLPWVGAAAFVILLALTWALPTLLRQLMGKGQVVEIKRELLSLTIVIAGLGWGSLGVIFWTTSAAFWPLELNDLPVFSFAMIAAMLIGLVAIFVPAGIGVRESVLVFILTPYVPPATVLFVAAAVRVVLLLGELFCLALIEFVLILMRPGDRQPAKTDGN
ncbi:MAG: lysylphosphatidylglycerol synthase domain-containing protein [Anaerolineales bacterium]